MLRGWEEAPGTLNSESGVTDFIRLRIKSVTSATHEAQAEPGRHAREGMKSTSPAEVAGLAFEAGSELTCSLPRH